jgi:hypothetical protein
VNPYTTVPPGGQIIYRSSLNDLGIFFFSDLGNTLSSKLGSNVHGLYGALFVQSRGSYWTDPITGQPINSAAFADIHNPTLPSVVIHTNICPPFYPDMYKRLLCKKLSSALMEKMSIKSLSVKKKRSAF